MVFFRNVQVRWTAVSGASADARARAPGASGDQGVYPTASSCRTSSRASRCPISGAYKYTEKWGYVARGASARINWDDTLADSSISSGTRRLGHQPQLEPQRRKNDVVRPPVRVRRRHPELHERLAGRHRDRQHSAERPRPSTASRFRSPASSPSSITRGTSSSARRSATPARTTTTPTARRRRLQGRAVRARQPALLPRAERHGRRRAAVGPPRELLRRLRSDGVKLQFSFKYNFSWKLGG
jgi:hypothetical protein